MKLDAIPATMVDGFSCVRFPVTLKQRRKIELNIVYGIKEIPGGSMGKRVSVKKDSGAALEGTVTEV